MHVGSAGNMLKTLNVSQYRQTEIRQHLTVICTEALAFWSSSKRLKLSTCIREVLGLNLGQDYPEVFHCFPQFLQANTGTPRFGQG
jgi:hypothetical protein